MSFLYILDMYAWKEVPHQTQLTTLQGTYVLEDISVRQEQHKKRHVHQGRTKPAWVRTTAQRALQALCVLKVT